MDYLRAFSAMVFCTLLSATAHAALVSEDSSFGTGTLTLDTDTGLQWLDVFVGSTLGTSSSTSFNSYNDVKSMMGSGGALEGYRYATRDELETLLFSSAGIDPVTSQNGSPTSTDSQRMEQLFALTDYTRGGGFGANYWEILDAVFEDPDTNSVSESVLKFSYSYGRYGDGTVSFRDPDVSSNEFLIYGHWLVKDNLMAAVDEPPMMALLGFVMLGISAATRRKWKQA